MGSGLGTLKVQPHLVSPELARSQAQVRSPSVSRRSVSSYRFQGLLALPQTRTSQPPSMNPRYPAGCLRRHLGPWGGELVGKGSHLRLLERDQGGREEEVAGSASRASFAVSAAQPSSNIKKKIATLVVSCHVVGKTGTNKGPGSVC